MDICLCGILFGVDTNKKQHKKLVSCLIVLLSAALVDDVTELWTSAHSRVAFPTKTRFFLFLPEWSLAPLTAPLTGRGAEFSHETSDWEWKVLVSCDDEMNSEECSEGGQPANWPEPTWTNCSTELQHWTAAVVPSSILRKWTSQSSQNGPFLFWWSFFFFCLLFQFQYFFISETSRFLSLDAVQFELKVEHLWGSEKKLFTGGEQRNISNTVMLLPHLVGPPLQFTAITKKLVLHLQND